MRVLPDENVSREVLPDDPKLAVSRVPELPNESLVPELLPNESLVPELPPNESLVPELLPKLVPLPRDPLLPLLRHP